MVAVQGPINSQLGKTIGTFQAAFFSFAGTIILAASIAGQLTMSVIIDQFGLLALDKDPINAMKALGVVLLFVGTLLVVRG
jgi:uncharacterized membrane protein YdcZ (DUF606 family)